MAINFGINNSNNDYPNKVVVSNSKKSENNKNEPLIKLEVLKDSISLTNSNKSTKPIVTVSLTENNDKEILSVANYKDKIVPHISKFYEDLKLENKLTTKQIKDIQNFSPEKKELFVKCLNELEALKSKKITAADYMINIMSHSVNLSGNDNKKFVELVGEVFSSVPIPLDPFRKILGAGPHSGGNILEPMFDKIIEEQGGSLGFNSNVTDDISKTNNMTHHVGEFLQVGFNRGSIIGKLSTDAIDRNLTFGLIQDKVNEGDIRSGYFSVMVGDALNDNKITPTDAVKLFKWAYTTEHGGKESPIFGAKETPEKYMNWKDYKIESWIEAYNKAFTDNKINSKS